MQNNQFVPAYYEWHFIQNGQTILNWVDPSESLQDAEDYDGVKQVVEDFLENCEGFPHNNKQVSIDKLPQNATEIMAKALYGYYME